MLQVKEPTLLDKIEARQAVVGICGLGYVGLPLALTFGGRASPATGSTSIPAKAPPLRKAEAKSAQTTPARSRSQNRPRTKASHAPWTSRKPNRADAPA